MAEDNSNADKPNDDKNKSLEEQDLESEREVAENDTNLQNQPDIGLGDSMSRNLPGSNNDTKPRTSRKEEDAPFSFTRFLKSSSMSQSSKSQAYPDLYSSTKRNDCDNASHLSQCTSGNSDITSALPDFVQDHLAIEQHYFNRNYTSLQSDNNLPDLSSYVPSSVSRGVGPDDEISGFSANSSRSSKSNIVQYSCDYRKPLRKHTNSGPSLNEDSSPENPSTVNSNRKPRNIPPLDLPIPYYCPERIRSERRIRSSNQALPFDLTQVNKSDSTFDTENSPVSDSRQDMQSTLPDFLSDSHIYSHSNINRSNRCTVTEQTSSESSFFDNRLEMLQIENDALRGEVEHLRELLARQTFRAEQAENALAVSRSVRKRECGTKPAGDVEKDEEIKTLKKRLENAQNLLQSNCASNKEDPESKLRMVEGMCSHHSSMLEEVSENTMNLISQILCNVSSIKAISKDLDILGKSKTCEQEEPNKNDKDDDDKCPL